MISRFSKLVYTKIQRGPLDPWILSDVFSLSGEVDSKLKSVFGLGKESATGAYLVPLFLDAIHETWIPNEEKSILFLCYFYRNSWIHG